MSVPNGKVGKAKICQQVSLPAQQRGRQALQQAAVPNNEVGKVCSRWPCVTEIGKAASGSHAQQCGRQDFQQVAVPNREVVEVCSRQPCSNCLRSIEVSKGFNTFSVTYIGWAAMR